MMITTHGFAGALIALPLYFIAPEFLTPAILGAFVGGVFPDMDLYHGHRKSLHYPVYYSLLALALFPVMFLFTSSYSVSAWFFFLSAGIHCFMDPLGAGRDSRPWEKKSDKAVYSHYHDRWMKARRWIRYDGSPEDLMLTLMLAAPVLYIVDGQLQQIALLMLTLSLFYTVFRKKGMEILPDRLLRPV